MSWQAMHKQLRACGWRRGADGLWRHTPAIGGSFLTRNALAIANGEPVQQVVERSRQRWLDAGKRLASVRANL